MASSKSGRNRFGQSMIRRTSAVRAEIGHFFHPKPVDAEDWPTGKHCGSPGSNQPIGCVQCIIQKPVSGDAP